MQTPDSWQPKNNTRRGFLGRLVGAGIVAAVGTEGKAEAREGRFTQEEVRHLQEQLVDRVNTLLRVSDRQVEQYRRRTVFIRPEQLKLDRSVTAKVVGDLENPEESLTIELYDGQELVFSRELTPQQRRWRIGRMVRDMLPEVRSVMEFKGYPFADENNLPPP